MKISYILNIFLFAILASCGDGGTNASGTDNSPELPKETKTTYLREPVEIIPSTGEDYPESLKSVGFPVIPQAEVTSVGNTEIENGTVVMQMETTKTIDQINKYYKKEMVANGWEEKKMNILQGADAAYSYRNQDYSARILVINDKVQDFRKIAVTLNKRVKIEDYQDN